MKFVNYVLFRVTHSEIACSIVENDSISITKEYIRMKVMDE